MLASLLNTNILPSQTCVNRVDVINRLNEPIIRAGDINRPLKRAELHAVLVHN